MSTEWRKMDTLRPPAYVCLRRKARADGSFPAFELDGVLEKDEWDHVPWSDTFVDIEAQYRKIPKEHPRTRVKIMYDDEWLYVGAELTEQKIWGTITERNSVMYEENDFEVFFDPDGSRHKYYEMEMNCLNTVWELLINKPYKDGHDIVNPHNLRNLRTAVYVDGVTNAPWADSHRWCIEMAFPLAELDQFDHQIHHNRKAVAHPGAVWKVNFSRVEYTLCSIQDEITGQWRFAKVPDIKEDNIVYAPTGVIDIHRPEKWAALFFSSQNEALGGQEELKSAMAGFLEERLAIERILDSVYYDQREFHSTHGRYASTYEELYAWVEGLGIELERPTTQFHHAFVKFDLQSPVLSCPQVEEDWREEFRDGRRASGEELWKHLSYAPPLDSDDSDGSDNNELQSTEPYIPPLKLKQTQQEKLKVATPRLSSRRSLPPPFQQTYVATVGSIRQQWNIRQDAKLWCSHHSL